MTHRRTLVLALITMVLASGLGAACGDDDAPARPASAERPADLDDVRDVFAADLAELGLRLTDRGGVVDVEGGYTASPTGRHLSVYVEPVAERTDQQYVDGILETARVLAPEIFERWSAIESFDVCQEPPTTVDDTEEPAPYTRLDMRRGPAEALDWDALDLPALLVTADEAAGEGVSIYVGLPIRRSDAFRAALAEAGISP